MGYTDQQLRDAIDAIFGQFDKDNSGALDPQEVYNLICAAKQHLDPNGPAPSQQEVMGFVQAVDKGRFFRMMTISVPL